MSIEELDMIIDWCREKIAYAKSMRQMNSKTFDGYETAMKAVMSYLHSLKKEKVNDEQIQTRPVHPVPCKIGDKIYEVTGEPGERIDIDEYIVSEVGLNGVFTHGGILGLRHRHYFAYEDEGAWWFFKREDAEAERKRRDDP